MARKPERVRVYEDANLTGTAAAHRFGAVLHVSPELMRRLAAAGQGGVAAVLEGVEITFWPALPPSAYASKLVRFAPTIPEDFRGL